MEGDLSHVVAQPLAEAPTPGSSPSTESTDDRARVPELRLLSGSRLFWVGLVLKVGCAALWGSHFPTRWFCPFVYEFVHGHFADPWAVFWARGEPMAFPYGPGMLLITSIPWLPAYVTSFDPSSHLGLFLLRVPVLAADLTICVLIMRWLRVQARDAVITYWMSPVVIYASYIHGQLDLIPTALLCVALSLMFAKRTFLAALVFGLALATKAHLLLALPFAIVYLYRRKRPRLAWLHFSAVVFATLLAFYALPLTSAAFRAMALGSAEIQKVWSVAVPYGVNGLVLYVGPAVIFVAFLRFASYRKVNRELTLMYIGALYVGLVALVPPQPGWFVWSIPFLAYLGARFTRTGRFLLVVVSVTYLTYFFAGDPVVFLEAFDPTIGLNFGARAAAALAKHLPWFASQHTANVAWTLLFSATALAGLEMYRKGVRSNSIYNFREESFMIGIAGDSGAGKHTIARDLSSLMGPQLSLINGDDDHKWERGHTMWRHYTHLNPRGNLLDAQTESLAALRRGGEVRKRHYNHDEGRFTSPLRIKPNDFIGIVGLHPFYLPSQRDLLHLRIFVDPEEQLRREWKVERDIVERGYSRERVLEQIEQRMGDSIKYIRPQMASADVILRHRATEGPADVALEVEMVSGLEPLTLVDALDAVATMEATWTPDADITRNRISIKGEIDAEQVRALAHVLLPDADELVHEEAWLPGGRGVTQVILLHAVAVRLRSSSAAREAA